MASAGGPRMPRGSASPSTPSSVGAGPPVASWALTDVPESVSPTSRSAMAVRSWCLTVVGLCSVWRRVLLVLYGRPVLR
jgi:hypothetical protein